MVDPERGEQLPDWIDPATAYGVPKAVMLPAIPPEVLAGASAAMDRMHAASETAMAKLSDEEIIAIEIGMAYAAGSLGISLADVEADE